MTPDEHNDELSVEIRFYEGILAEDPEYVDALIPLAEAYTKAGLYNKGLAVDLKLAALRPDDATVNYNLACSYALTERKDEALAALQRAIELGYRDVDFLLRDHDLVSLHDEEKFVQLIARFFPHTDLNIF